MSEERKPQTVNQEDVGQLSPADVAGLTVGESNDPQDPPEVPGGEVNAAGLTPQEADSAQENMDGSAALIEEPFLEIKFQLGPIKEVGVNGTTIERILEVLAARLEGFQRGPFACQESGLALQAIQEALKQLNHRTHLREAQKVEGENKTHMS